MKNEPEAARARILTSWKEIANYLGKGVRTVQRWEQFMGLPVRRPEGQENKVLAYCSDLDEWLQSNWSQRPSRESGADGKSDHLDVYLLRERCEDLRERQKILREQLERSVMALYEQCNTLRRTCVLPAFETGEKQVGRIEEATKRELSRPA